MVFDFLADIGSIDVFTAVVLGTVGRPVGSLEGRAACRADDFFGLQRSL